MNARYRTGVALIVLIAAVVVGAWRLVDKTDNAVALPDGLEPFQLPSRPQSDRYLFDYAGALEHYEEGAHRYLHSITERFHVEALIVSLPNLPEGHDIDTLANDLVNSWRIGASHEGRGLLLLLVDDVKSVKLEVTYQLEDVFTDSFTGWVEDLELGPYYRNGDTGTGLIAVLEVLEERAEKRHLGAFSPGQIARADAVLLAGGAGARRNLRSYAQDNPANATQGAPGARSPEEAWEIMISQWGGGGKDLDVDIYTRMTRRAMGDPRNPDPRTLSALDHWRTADYQVLRDGDHAVIWFGAVDGWDNAPFLFCNTGAGWKFDIVHQRRLVVMAEAPRWQITQGPYPYVSLMGEARQTTSKDIPLAGDDLYRCADDQTIDTRMRKLETELTTNPDAAAATLELMRLAVITGQRPNIVRPLIDRARQLAPDAADPHRYAAIYNINSFFQYETALFEIEQYLVKRPRDLFGFQLKGFLLYRLGRYAESIDVLQHAVDIDANDAYAYALMARDYALLARSAIGSEKHRLRSQATTMQNRAAAAPSAPSRTRFDRPRVSP